MVIEFLNSVADMDWEIFRARTAIDNRGGRFDLTPHTNLSRTPAKRRCKHSPAALCTRLFVGVEV